MDRDRDIIELFDDEGVDAPSPGDDVIERDDDPDDLDDLDDLDVLDDVVALEPRRLGGRAR